MRRVQHAVQVFAVIHLGTMGLSHVLAPRAWVEFFLRLRAAGDPGVFVAGAISLLFGSVVAAFHPVWSGPGVVLTLVGWGQVLKGSLYLVFPAIGRRGLARVQPGRERGFVLAGAGLLGVVGVVVAGWLV